MALESFYSARVILLYRKFFSGGYLRQNPGFKYKYTSYERKTQKDEKKSASLKAART